MEPLANKLNRFLKTWSPYWQIAVSTAQQNLLARKSSPDTATSCVAMFKLLNALFNPQTLSLNLLYQPQIPPEQRMRRSQPVSTLTLTRRMLGKSRAPYDLYKIPSQELTHMGCRVPTVLTPASDRTARTVTAVSAMQLLETATKTDHLPHKWASQAELSSLGPK